MPPRILPIIVVSLLAPALPLHANPTPPPPSTATPPRTPTPATGRTTPNMVGEDHAAMGDYGSGWGTGKNGGSGFGPWTLRESTLGADSHAGFYAASTDNNPDLKAAVATRGKAFGLYANGVGFELTTAFRPLETPLKVGQSFSWLMQHGELNAKSDRDPADASGSVGLTLRAGNAASDKPEDYNANSRLEFGFYKDSRAYTVYDGDGQKRLDDVPFSDGALAVTVTLRTADTYDLEVTSLASSKTTRLTGRKLGGTAGAPVGSFAVFNRNSEAQDFYVNGFQLLGP